MCGSVSFRVFPPARLAYAASVKRLYNSRWEWWRLRSPLPLECPQVSEPGAPCSSTSDLWSELSRAEGPSGRLPLLCAVRSLSLGGWSGSLRAERRPWVWPGRRCSGSPAFGLLSRGWVGRVAFFFASSLPEN